MFTFSKIIFIIAIGIVFFNGCGSQDNSEDEAIPLIVDNKIIDKSKLDSNETTESSTDKIVEESSSDETKLDSNETIESSTDKVVEESSSDEPKLDLKETIETPIDTVVDNNITVSKDINETKKETKTSDVKIFVGTSFHKQLNNENSNKVLLTDAPLGMSILPNGLLTWTPTKNQIGNYKISFELYFDNLIIEQKEFELEVLDKNISYNGVFVNPTGVLSKDTDGTPLHPYTTFKEACQQIKIGENIYIRGGIYHNQGFGENLHSSSRYPTISGCVGTKENPITLKPWGNENVKIVTDTLYGFKIKSDVKYFIIDGFEIEGISNKLSQNDVVAQWWDENDLIKGTGISINGSYITVKNNIIHHMPGSGISAFKATYVKIEDNIVYNCDWWTISGSHGIGITQSQEDSTNSSEDKFYNKITNNLIFGVEQRIISRVWAKGFVTLEIDEGEAFLIQEGKQQDNSSSSSYKGKYLVENNIIAYNGKSGVINLAKNTTIKNNSYYLNGTNTKQAGFRINKSSDIELSNNVIVANENTFIYSVGGDDIPVLSHNYGENGKDKNLPIGLEKISFLLFNAPKKFDFSLNKQLPQDIGANQSIVTKIQKKLTQYKIVFKPTNFKMNKEKLTQSIIDAKPKDAIADYTHYDDNESYITIQNLPLNHPAGNEIKLYIKHKFDMNKKLPYLVNTPKTLTYVNDYYQFQPIIQNQEDEQFIFTIKNKPHWADFNSSTGLLSGIVTDSNISQNIIITLSNDSIRKSLKPFSIEIEDAKNIAHLYAKAIQPPENNYRYYKAPENVIDGNFSTNNHTECSDPYNWLELEFPQDTKIDKIIIHNHSSNQNRLDGTKVYMNSTFIQSLTSDSIQTISFDSSYTAEHILFKNKENDDDACIHLFEIEVFGTIPVIPVFQENETEFLISSKTAVDTEITQLSVIDYQDDILKYRILDDVPFSIDNKGFIRSEKSLESLHKYSFKVEVDDGINSATIELTIETTSFNSIEEILKSGDIISTFVTEEEILDAILDEVEDLNKKSFIDNIYDNEKAIKFIPGNYDSQLIETKNYQLKEDYNALLIGQKENIFALAGLKENQRFAIYAFNPFVYFMDDSQLDYEYYMKRVLAWLIVNNPDETMTQNDKKISFVFVDNEDKTEQWFEKNYDFSLSSCNSKDELSECLKDSNLIVIGKGNGDEATAQRLKEVLEQLNKPILYVHPNWGENALSTMIENYFNFKFPYGGNYWADDTISLDSSSELFQKEIKVLSLDKIKKLITHFKEEDFNFNWSQCYKLSDNEKVYGEDYDKCQEVVGLKSDFFDNVDYIKNTFNQIDKDKLDIFSQKKYKLWKLLALLGDKYRQNIHYPMDKVKTSQIDYFKSLYSDFSLYNYRKIVPKQQDMGNFSRSDFSNITPITIIRDFSSKKPFRSAGVYVLPSQSIKITRTDNNQNVETDIFINSIRSGATHIYQKNGYNRPKYLQSVHYSIAVGESILITHPYGGTLQIAFDTNEQNISFKFENVAQHPVWSYWMNDEEKEQFETSLENNEFDWAEIITPNFELHSKLDKMKQSIDDTKYNSDLNTFIDAINIYTSNYPYSLAGFQGDGIEEIQEVKEFASEQNLSIKKSDFVKHMNADQATCGYGCSGNPYDAYWAFDPVGHGDIHEIGHGLEKSKFRFDGWNYHASTNPYSYYTKSRFNKDHESDGIETECQNLPFKKVFGVLKESINENNITQYLQENLWKESSWSEQVLFEIQAMMYVQKMNKLEDGWHLLTRIHLLERAINSSKDDWDNQKENIGFSEYSLDEFNNLSKNDWLLVSYSFASTLDFRPFFDMYGIEYSTKAYDQIESFSYEAVAKKFFVSTPDGYCKKDDYGEYLDKDVLELNDTFPY